MSENLLADLGLDSINPKVEMGKGVEAPLATGIGAVKGVASTALLRQSIDEFCKSIKIVGALGKEDRVLKPEVNKEDAKLRTDYFTAVLAKIDPEVINSKKIRIETDASGLVSLVTETDKGVRPVKTTDGITVKAPKKATKGDTPKPGELENVPVDNTVKVGLAQYLIPEVYASYQAENKVGFKVTNPSSLSKPEYFIIDTAGYEMSADLMAALNISTLAKSKGVILVEVKKFTDMLMDNKYLGEQNFKLTADGYELYPYIKVKNKDDKTYIPYDQFTEKRDKKEYMIGILNPEKLANFSISEVPGFNYFRYQNNFIPIEQAKEYGSVEDIKGRIIGNTELGKEVNFVYKPFEPKTPKEEKVIPFEEQKGLQSLGVDQDKYSVLFKKVKVGKKVDFLNEKTLRDEIKKAMGII